MTANGIVLGNTNGGATVDFWEAWPIPANANSSYLTVSGGADDTYHSDAFPACSKGQIRTRGRYTEVIGGIPDTMHQNNPNVPWSGGGNFSSLDEPVYNPAGPMRHHDLVIKWNCCCEVTPFLGVGLPIIF